MSRQLCSVHPNVDYKKEWGCPDCIVELRKQNLKLSIACHAALMFHSEEEWTHERREFWRIALETLLGPLAERDQQTNEATTKNLCNAIRAALKAAEPTNKQTV